jgi:diadenosine tetraphosphatase ApaH/serine/threonine PP2A family protein phosphatase
VRYLILTDLHANLPALDAVLADAAAIGYDKVIVLGDLVGYGADPAAVMDRTLALNPVAIVRGNHDKVCAGLESSEFFNDIAKHSVEWTMAQLTPGHLQALAALPKGPRLVTDDLEICHGSPFDEDYYVFDEEEAARALEATSGRICLFGHTHIPAVFFAGAPLPPDAELLAGPEGDELPLPAYGQALVNVGSVGQPRDGDPRAAYGILDLSANVMRLHRVTYNVARAQKSILDAGLPFWLAARLERGQ